MRASYSNNSLHSCFETVATYLGADVLHTRAHAVQRWKQGRMSTQDAILDELLVLIHDYHQLNSGQVTRVDRCPSAIEFSKQVSRSLPCVYPAPPAFSGFIVQKWTRKYLLDTVTEPVEVATTPDGLADSLTTLDSGEKVFLQPSNIDIRLGKLFEELDPQAMSDRRVFYLQSQNDNLTTTALQSLLQDLPRNFDFAQEILGKPDAINLWIGDEKSITSAHRDPYENLYIVLRGTKVFTLWPPVDELCMDTIMVRTGRWQWNSDTNAFEIVMDSVNESDEVSKIPWVTVDPQQPREVLNQLHPFYKHARSQTVEVHAGEMLYLPSGWFHHVTQRCGSWDDGTTAPCIAVNYWYEQDYDGEKDVMRQFLGAMTRRVLQRG